MAMVCVPFAPPCFAPPVAPFVEGVGSSARCGGEAEGSTMFRSWTSTGSCRSASPSQGPEQVAGLRRAFTEAGLASYIPSAEDWCERMGAVFLEEVVEEAETLCNELQLQSSQSTRLLQSLGRDTGLEACRLVRARDIECAPEIRAFSWSGNDDASPIAPKPQPRLPALQRTDSVLDTDDAHFEQPLAYGATDSLAESADFCGEARDVSRSPRALRVPAGRRHAGRGRDHSCA